MPQARHRGAEWPSATSATIASVVNEGGDEDAGPAGAPHDLGRTTIALR